MATTVPEPAGFAAEAEASPKHADVEALLKLATFLSPAFPIGAFSFSHGLEAAIDVRVVATAGTMREWIADLLAIGSGWNDAVLFAAACRSADNPTALRDIAAIAEALAGSRERHLETIALGRAFLDAVAVAWPCATERHLAGTPAPYPVAVAAVCAEHGIALSIALPLYLNAFAANLVSVGVRLIPIGQSAGLAILSSLHQPIVVTAARAARSTLDDLGSATCLADIASMRHEAQYSRVFRT